MIKVSTQSGSTAEMRNSKSTENHNWRKTKRNVQEERMATLDTLLPVEEELPDNEITI